MDYGLWIEYGLWIMDWIWIGFGFNISELNGYGLDLELELSPSGTSDHKYSRLKLRIWLLQSKITKVMQCFRQSELLKDSPSMKSPSTKSLITVFNLLSIYTDFKKCNLSV